MTTCGLFKPLLLTFAAATNQPTRHCTGTPVKETKNSLVLPMYSRTNGWRQNSPRVVTICNFLHI